jgi:3-isopropylmalate/(R)-2-methylmalate dehydratase large subunit
MMTRELEKNIKEYGIKYFGLDSSKQGIIHIIGPELGLSQPGLTIACGDSHTSTHGALGSLAFGIGTSEIRQVLETQSLALSKLKVRRININGQLGKGVGAKDIILKIIQALGVKGGVGYAYEFGGDVIANFDIDHRLTICNMSIEGGARIGYINPDDITYEYLKDKEYTPKGKRFDEAKNYWKSFVSDINAEYDDIFTLIGDEIEPMVTWGTNPGQCVGISACIPEVNAIPSIDRDAFNNALSYMQFKPGQSMLGTKIDVAFIGSCTNGRLSDLREAAAVLKNNKVKKGIKVLIVPGSRSVKQQAEAEGLHEIFQTAGAEWRLPGCSLCLAMNSDKLIGDQVCAATSNRNFVGRQGSPTGRTLLMSPLMAAAAAIEGHVVDAREYI